jgi:hypothetical protein
MGPDEASWAVNELIKPKATIPTHAHEVSTKGGKVKPGSKADNFMKPCNSASIVQFVFSC